MNKNFIFVALGLGFAAYFGNQVYTRAEAAKRLAEQTVEDSVPTVAVTHVKPSDPVKTIALPGNIEAWFQAPIYAQVSGYVKVWCKDYGAEVKKGDVLAEINAPALTAQYEQAKADMEAQRAKYNIAQLTAQRYGAMRASNAVPMQTISVVEADARVEEARLNAALQNVKNFAALIKFTTIVAPYDGVIVSRDINVGDYVNKEGDVGSSAHGSTPLFLVADIHRMRLFVSVPESFGQYLKPGMKADVTVPQFPGRKFTADFLTVAKGFKMATRTAVTEFTIENDDRTLWPGSYASVKVSATFASGALVIPATALVFDENGTQIAVVTKQSKVHFKPIQTTKILDSEIEVIKGVTLEDRLIDNPSAALLEGDLVKVVTPAPGNTI